MRKLLPFLLTFILPLVACGGSTGPGEQRVDGTYTLVHVNGKAPPALVYSGTVALVEITGGTLVLCPDFSYRERINLREVLAARAPVTQDEIKDGTYTEVGSTITLTVSASGGKPSSSYTGAVSSNTVTYTFAGFSLVYRK